MTPDQALDALADHHGILSSFRDLAGQERPTNADTKKALLRAIGLDLDNSAMIMDAWRATRATACGRLLPPELVVEANKPGPDLPRRNWQLQIEGQAPVEGRGSLPSLVAGVHTLTLQNAGHSEEVTLIAVPDAAPSTEDLTGQSRLWGISAALYGMRSSRNLGLGDFEDLAQFARTAAGVGAAFVGINPVHALGWSDTSTFSPYSPSHRGFLNTLHIAADKVPGLEASDAATRLLVGSAQRFASLRARDLIDYPRFRSEFTKLLEDLFDLFEVDASLPARTAFERFLADEGQSLQDFACFEALSEIHGPDWRNWPSDLRSPHHDGVDAARKTCTGRIRFHNWLQWVATTQLSAAQTGARTAGMPLGLYLDLAVGPRRGGAESWMEAESIAQGVSIGAPPDHLGPGGQNWNLAAYAPLGMMQSRYRPFRQVLRQSMRYSGLLRIDHALGMERSFWLPDDGSPGGYVRQPLQSLLAIVAIEADRARCAVIGEDLGLVPEGFRDAIHARGLYSYSVLQYEKDEDGAFRPPDRIRARSLACFGTHDTPTISGYWSGRDIDVWHDLGRMTKQKAGAAHGSRQSETAGLTALTDSAHRGQAPVDPIMAVHSTLAGSPAAMVSVQFDDLLGEVDAQNLPGTIDEHPNWRRRARTTIERLTDLPALTETGRMMRESGRSPRQTHTKESGT